MSQLLTRQEFREQVFARQKGRCAFCELPCVDPHHIIERKLWGDGGYYLDNGIGVCEAHHWMLETTEISVQQARAAAGITTVPLPEGFDPVLEYDKWGNMVVSENQRLPGLLFAEPSVQNSSALPASVLLESRAVKPPL